MQSLLLNVDISSSLLLALASVLFRFMTNCKSSKNNYLDVMAL